MDRNERELAEIKQELRLLHRKLDSIMRLQIITMEMTMAVEQELEDLTAEVAEVQTVEGSVVVLLDGILSRLDQAAFDRTKLTALKEALRGSRDALAAAAARVPPAPNPAVTNPT